MCSAPNSAVFTAMDASVASNLLDWASQQTAIFAKSGFAEELKTETNYTAKRLFDEVYGLQEAPASGGERNYIRKVVARTQQRLEARGIHLANAALQALLWHHEKRLWRKMGYSAPKAKDQDFAKASRVIVDQVKAGTFEKIRAETKERERLKREKSKTKRDEAKARKAARQQEQPDEEETGGDE